MLRTYIYDILGRPTARNTARQGSVVNDTFAHNTRSELVEAQVNGKVHEYAYDSQGRPSYKKVSTNGSVTIHRRFIYRGYLQIAAIDLTRSHHPVMSLLTWDSSQSPRGLGGGLDKPRSKFAPQGVSRQWGAGESTCRHTPAGHPHQWHLALVRLCLRSAS